MTDLRISEVTNDIVITQGRPEMVTGSDAKAQRIRSRLLTVRGEWFLDTLFGLDYHGVVWVKTTPWAVLAAHVKRAILQEADRGDKITKFDLAYDTTTRTLNVTVQLTGSDGTTTSVSI